MRVAIAFGDAGHHVAIDGIALVRPVDGDPERRPALFTYHAVLVGHFSCPLRHLLAGINGGMAADSKDDLRRRRWHGFPDPDLIVMECGAADRRHGFGPG